MSAARNLSVREQEFIDILHAHFPFSVFVGDITKVAMKDTISKM